ncbi:unnamed protein product [Thelazia callipaeda]|uniref:Secreted protein n=1 Tax=Thelazia callipaeda TaxID=103827 RepID=A0A0N5D5F4_THECL|nr:unnamed protein product [Thelazia callipaeda]
MTTFICMQIYVILFPILYSWCFGCPCSGPNTADLEFQRVNKDEAVQKKKAATRAAEILHQQRLRAQQKRIRQRQQTKLNENKKIITIPDACIVQAATTPAVLPLTCPLNYKSSTKEPTPKSHLSPRQKSVVKNNSRYVENRGKDVPAHCHPTQSTDYPHNY